MNRFPAYNEHYPIAKLVVPTETYQRSTSNKRVDDMILAGFDPYLFGAILVSENTHHVMDGGHRLALAKKLGMTEVPALVYPNMTIETEARVFDRFNGVRKPVSLRTRHAARVIYHDPEALAVQSILDKLPIPSQQPLATIDRLYRLLPAPTLETTPVLAELGEQSPTKPLLAGIIDGLVWLQSEHPEYGIADAASVAWERLSNSKGYERLYKAYIWKLAKIKKDLRKVGLPATLDQKAEAVLFALNNRPVGSGFAPQRVQIGA